ncbi:sigma-70 family RNA polymerase sigma factor [Humibacillus xanthopallidus]|uniref:RNA polymerase sigma factor (Sigma-70 family) n=1 Tax=Humibacillus xanthopallidus TaxID=412689 RepID=A0A543I0R4_9MICO|nr:sigma-70 family RNA polymerase sigma factor [Humibacillus xanthopallidus]TQM64183.1 RNA polymerase sigma factor (sigma-70 family) [Humibacillus xanthopallidus]
MSAETALWSRDAWESAPDEVLLREARAGSAEAYGELWRRHLPAAYGVAGKHGGRTPAEDIVAEAATKIFTLLQSGRGPDEHFRAYFLTTVRTVAADHTRRELRLLPVSDDDLERLAEPAEGADDTALETGDAGGSELYDTELVRAAFAGLPERDQRVLWHTTVEGEPPRVVAPMLGMTAGAVSSRAMRARESLRSGYLDAYAERCLEHAESRECSWTIERLGRLVRGRLPRRQTERAEAHLASCPHAAAVAADLREIQRGFPALVVPLVLTVGFGSSGLAAALGFAGVGAAGVGAGAAALTAMGEVPGVAPDPAAAGALADGSVGEGTGPGAGAVSESSQAASRVAVLLAAGVVALGLVAAAVTSGQSDTPPAATARPGSSSPSGSAAATATPSTSTAITPTGTTTSSPTASATSAAGVPSGQNAAAGSGVTGAATARPGATTVRRAPAPAPQPTSAAPAPPPATGVAARLLGGGDPSRISLRVPGAAGGGALTVTVSTASGAGSLTAGNRTFTCTQSSRSSLSCVGDGGQIQLMQSGTGGPAPLVVRVRDAAGAVTQSVVVPS